MGIIKDIRETKRSHKRGDELPNRIKERRKELGITQAELAEKVKITISYLSTIENEKRKVPIQLMYRIAFALGTNINEIFFN